MVTLPSLSRQGIGEITLMCGIVGWMGPSIDVTIARQMSKAIAHRGPDDHGEWAEEGIWLAHRRLSILDLSPAGRQPMISASGRYVITYNGEIYNSPELSKELAESGHIFRGHSDTEVMLAAFEEWGVEPALGKFNGMFAFAVWDRQTRRLLLARDRMGEKPLYFAERDGSIAFASELGGLWHLPWLDRRVDRTALAAYLRYLCVPAPATIVRGARKLSPGTIYRWQDGRGETRAYWTIDEVANSGFDHRLELGMEEAADALEGLLRDAVRIRMRSDVPYGAFLSGGIDSSLVVAMMQQESRQPARTFTIGFTEKSHDESAHARAVASHLGTQHAERFLSPREVIDLVTGVARIHDEPFADSSSVPTMLLARFAREQVTVALSGDGGDELFGGYPRYFWAGRIGRLRQRLGPFGSRAFAGLLDSAPRSLLDGGDRFLLARKFGGANGLGDRVHRFASYLRNPPEAVYRSIISAWKEPGLIAPGQFHEGLDPDLSAFARMGWAEKMMAADQKNYLPDDILTKMDRATMAVSLEGRAPLLDHRLVEWSWRVAPHLKLSDTGDSGKLLMRRVLYRFVPAEMMERPKMGFGMPIGKWLRGDLREWAESLLTPEVLAGAGLEPAPVREAWKAHLLGSNRLAEVWSILTWVQWQTHWRATL